MSYASLNLWEHTKFPLKNLMSCINAVGISNVTQGKENGSVWTNDAFALYAVI